MAEEKELLSRENVNLQGFDRVELLDSVGSTNDYAKELLADSDALARASWGELSAIATGDQRAGHGRLDRVWTAPYGTCLATSFIVRPHANPAVRMDPASYHWLTMILALAAVDTLDDLGVRASIKWPNDLLVGGKKICGILAQLVVEPDGKFSVVAGIGLNLNFSAEELPVDTATSVLLERGKRADFSEALTGLGKHFARRYRDFVAVGADASAPTAQGLSLLDTLRARMSTLGQQVNIHLPGGQIIQGEAVDINADGEILVRDSEGTVTAYAVGDVVHLRPRKF